MTTEEERFASHLTVLEELCEEHDVRRVLEVGCGYHSTPFFLNLPHLERLVSIETDPEWADAIREDHPAYDRLEMVLVDNAAQALAGYLLTDFDLVFIDNGTTPGERLEVINHVMSRCHPLVVVHDAEVREYREAIGGFGHELHGVPWTAVIR